jgi:hypothetical protein
VRFLMLIAADAERSARWLDMSPDERAAAEAPLHQWFERHAAAGRIETGHELAYPREAVAITREGGAVAREPVGPDAVLSGVLVLELESLADAVELASTWPDLVAPADVVTVIPIHSYEEV